MFAMFGFVACSPTSGESGSAAGGEPAASDAPDEASNAGDADLAEAVFAGGCFWCTEAVFEQIEGVASVVSGYAGGDAETANYEAVSTGQTDHAEAIRIRYDPKKVDYRQLLEIHFASHDPTQVNRQGPDVGPQYRTAIFYAEDEQRRIASEYIAELDKSGKYDKPVATTLEPLEAFYPAEGYHQDFAKRNPVHPYIRIHSDPKVEKVRKHFQDAVKESE